MMGRDDAAFRPEPSLRINGISLDGDTATPKTGVSRLETFLLAEIKRAHAHRWMFLVWGLIMGWVTAAIGLMVAR